LGDWIKLAQNFLNILKRGGEGLLNFNRMITTVDMHVAGEPLRIITG